MPELLTFFMYADAAYQQKTTTKNHLYNSRWEKKPHPRINFWGETSDLVCVALIIKLIIINARLSRSYS